MPDADKISNRAGWNHFTHVADIGVDGFGDTPASAFEQAALALTGIIVEPAAIQSQTTIEIRCEAPGLEYLLVDWLNALIYEMSVRKMLFGSFEVHIDGNVLRGTAHGEPINVERHQPAAEPKGATLSELSVRKQSENGLWHARCVVDV